MKNRVCRLNMEIEANGLVKRYSLTPLSAVEIGAGFVTGYRLIGRSDEPQPVYLVRVRESGAMHCNCPAFSWEERKALAPGSPPDQPDASCKHCEALQAAGAVARSLLDVLKSRTRLLDHAERQLKNRDLEREAACRNVDSLRKTITQLEGELHDIRQRALQLQTALAAQTATPQRRTRKKVAA